MKKVVYLALVAMVAVVATSCKPKGDAPKAGFDYANEGLVVTFTNSSTGATSYAWDFGDGIGTSTEKDPVYTYAEYGTYQVTMVATNEYGSTTATEEVVLVQPVIVIDGDFADWDAAPAADVAVSVCPESTAYEDLYVMKFITDADYIYFYLEFNGDGEEDDWVVDPLSFYMNVDGDETTGSNSWLWDNSAADVLVQGTWIDNLASAGFFTHPATAPQDEWAWEDAGGVGAMTCSNKVDLGGGKAALEGSIMRAMMPITPIALKVGVYTSNTAWTENGVLPGIVLDGDGASTPSPLLEVKLN